jgi:hypothetical protein
MANKPTAEAPAEIKKDPKSMNLAQKFVELRKACPEIIKKQHSDGVKYKFAKIFDVYELLAPAMNEWGVDWEIVKEEATRHDELGNAKYYDSYTQKLRDGGSRSVWIYEADLTLRWYNVDDPKETRDITLHAVGTNDSGPDKAKGSAWTYCLKYYLFEKFQIDQGEDDPDHYDHSSDVAPADYNRQNGAQRSAGLSDAQLNRMYKKGEASQISKEAINDWIAQKYGKDKPEKMTRAEYDEVCKRLDERKAKEEQQNAE